MNNRIKGALDSNGVALGFGVQTFSTMLVEIAGRSGVDFVWLDLEHGGFSPYDTKALEDLARAADTSGISLLVRVPGFDDKIMGKVLDTGVSSILVTDVTSKEDAAKAVAASKYFPPTGRTLRGAGVARSFGWSAPNPETVKSLDQQILLGIMLEDKNVIDNLEEILSVKGIDFVFIGPQDLSVTLGVGFQTSHPLVAEYVEKARSIATKMGIPVGYPASDGAKAKDAIKAGFKIVRIGVDTAVVAREITNSLKTIRS